MSTGLKLFIKLACLATLVAVAGPFILKAPDGRPFLDWREILPVTNLSVPDLSGWSPDLKPGGGNGGKTKIYRWQSDDGSVQFSDTEPVGDEYEIIWIDPDTNLIQGQAADTPDKQETPSQTATNQKPSLPPIFTISPEQVEKLKTDAEKVQSLLDDRHKTLEEL